MNQFEGFSAAKNNTVDAEAAARQAVEIYTDLYKANPAQFGVDLAVAMGKRASAANMAGDKDRATEGEGLGSKLEL